MSERLDALLSAQQDGALEPAERAELEQLLETSEAARQRAAELARVDAALRRLGAERIPAERLARSWDAIARRGAGAALDADAPRRLSPWRRFVRGLPGSGIAAALAAGLVVAVFFGLRSGPVSQDVRPSEGSAGNQPVAGVRPADGRVGQARSADGRAPAAMPSDGLAPDGEPGDLLAADALAALEVDALGLEQADDVEVVAELELLEFIAAREREAQEPRG